MSEQETREAVLREFTVEWGAVPPELDTDALADALVAARRLNQQQKCKVPHRIDELDFAGCAACAWRHYHDVLERVATALGVSWTSDVPALVTCATQLRADLAAAKAEAARQHRASIEFADALVEERTRNLQSDLARAQEDVRRVDWLQRYLAPNVEYPLGSDATLKGGLGGVELAIGPWAMDEYQQMRGVAFDGADLRAALDAALRAAGAPPEGNG